MSIVGESLRPWSSRARKQPNGALSTQLRCARPDCVALAGNATSPADSSALEQACERVERVRLDRIREPSRSAAVLARMPEQPRGVRVAAVGKATAQVLRQRGWQVDVVPDDAEAGALVTALASEIKAGTRVLYPASSRALPTMSKGLAQLGAEVTQVEAYRTERAALDVAECRQWIERGSVGAVTFASPSAVHRAGTGPGQSGSRSAAVQRRAPLPSVPRRRAPWPNAATCAVVAEAATLAGLAATALRALQTRH